MGDKELAAADEAVVAEQAKQETARNLWLEAENAWLACQQAEFKTRNLDVDLKEKAKTLVVAAEASRGARHSFLDLLGAFQSLRDRSEANSYAEGGNEPTPTKDASAMVAD